MEHQAHVEGTVELETRRVLPIEAYARHDREEIVGLAFEMFLGGGVKEIRIQTAVARIEHHGPAFSQAVCRVGGVESVCPGFYVSGVEIGQISDFVVEIFRSIGIVAESVQGSSGYGHVDIQAVFCPLRLCGNLPARKDEQEQCGGQKMEISSFHIGKITYNRCNFSENVPSILKKMSFRVGGDGSDCGSYEADKVGGGDFDLQAADAGADVDRLEIERGSMEIGREALLHADRGATSSDVACHGKQVLHRDHLDLLVA